MNNTRLGQYNDTITIGNWWTDDICTTSQILQANSTKGLLTRLDNEACIKTYGPGNGLMTGYANLLAVTKQQPAESNNTVLMAFKYEQFISNYTGNRWVCDPNYLIDNKYKCNYNTLAKDANSWSLGRVKSETGNPWRLASTDEWPIDYCLAEPTDLTGMCQLQYSLVIMLCVLAANFTKLFCIVFILTTHLDQVLATIGDAISSFLENPDPVTIDRPFLSRGQALNFNINIPGKAAPYHPARLRWWQAPTWKRWLVTLFLCILAIAIVGKLLTYGNDALMSLATGEYSSP